jgi:hypothetical protein
MSTRNCALLWLLLPPTLLGAVPLGCDMLKMSPENICAKGKEFADKAGKNAGDQAACVKSFTQMKEKTPEAYDCMAKCAKEADSEDKLVECGGKCAALMAKASQSGATGDPGASAGDATVDGVTPASIKGKLSSEYQYYGYELIKEASNAAGWVGTVMLGKKGEEAQIYSIILSDVSSKADGDATVSKLYADSKDKKAVWKVGNKKVLYVECLSAVSSVSREPGPCYVGDRSRDMIDQVTK